MALWKPYADDVPLDLSRTAAPDTPLPCPAECYAPPPPNYPAYSGYTPQLPVPMAYQPYNKQLTQISPGSSGYASSSISPKETRHLKYSPPQTSTEHAVTLPYHMVDANTLSDDPAFQEFERNALRMMAEKNGGALLGNNPRMRRTVRATHAGAADDAYRCQRERNNRAAKQSMDRRKRREIDTSLKVSSLKKQYAALKVVARTTVCSSCQQSF